MANEPENLTVQLIRDIMARMATKEDLARLATKEDFARLATKIDVNSLRAAIASDMDLVRKDLSDQIEGLRRTVVEYHSLNVGTTS
jgi:hypothetical protein